MGLAEVSLLQRVWNVAEHTEGVANPFRQSEAAT